MSDDKYRRRQQPEDPLVPKGSRAVYTGPKAEGGGDDAAIADYYGNLKKFERHDDMAAEPTRNKGNESGQKP